MSTKPGMLSTMSGRLSTYPVKRLSTTSGNKQKTVNRNQEKTLNHDSYDRWQFFEFERKRVISIYILIYIILIFIFSPFFKNCHLSSVIIWQPRSLLKACWSLNVRMLIFMCEITDRLGCAYWSLWMRALLKNGGNVHRLSGLWRCLWATPVQTVLLHGCAWPI